MSDDIKATKRAKRLKFFFFKTPIILMIFVAIMIGALKLVERYPNPLRQGFEQYLSDATQTNATIGTLEKIQFFPTVIFKAQDITFHNYANAAKIDLNIESIIFEAPFSSSFLGTGKFINFDLKNMTAKKDFLIAHSMKINEIKINHNAQSDDEKAQEAMDDKPSILIDGFLSGKKMTAILELKAKKYNYQFADPMPFIFTLGEYKINGNLNRNFSDVLMDDLTFEKGNKKAEPKTYILMDSDGYNKDNPIYCLLMNEDLKKCDKYL